MKNILLSLTILTMFLFCPAFADMDFAAGIQGKSMPSDAEIMQTLNRFNFTAEQKEQLFKETKKKLESMYNEQSSEQINQELNAQMRNIQNMNAESYSDDYADEE